jgi:hypothetical protein
MSVVPLVHRVPGCTCWHPWFLNKEDKPEEQQHERGCALLPDLSKWTCYADGDYDVYINPEDPSFVFTWKRSRARTGGVTGSRASICAAWRASLEKRKARPV